METVVDRIRAGELPDHACEALVRGFLPVPPEELFVAICLIVKQRDVLFADALSTLETMPEAAFKTFLEDKACDPDVLDFYLHRVPLPGPAKAVALLNHQTRAETLRDVAPSVEAEFLDLVVNNQVKILEEPEIVDALRNNPHLSINQKQKLDDYERLLLKDLVSPAEELEDIPIEEVERQALQEAKEFVAVFGHEKLSSKDFIQDIKGDEDDSHNVLKQIARMSVPQKVQAAIKGNREVRGILIRDANKLVCSAAIRSPRITEAEVEFYSNLRNVQTDVLRLIALNREWTKNYKIIHNLVRNPRTPLAFTTKFLSRLTQRDLKFLQMDKNVPEVLRKMAKRMARTGK
ncbi:MAG: hypothetical protein KDC35_04320 [Acidobacteria bacterium]|nr:hypothetical protein [Acidobacteriota bacterium]